MDSGASKIPEKVLRWLVMRDRSAQESRAAQRAKIERLIGPTCEGCHRPDRPYGRHRQQPSPLRSGAIAMLGEKCSDELEHSQIAP
jgi:hypothetical protein